MNEIYTFLDLYGPQEQTIQLWEMFFALALSLVCSLSISWVYRWSHRSTSYSVSYVQNLIMVSLVTTVIMVVIGSNIARAFSLVGALSVIRFRNAIKESRDVGYIFFAMAIAMACGTRFYIFALMATVFINGVMLLFQSMNYGQPLKGKEAQMSIEHEAGIKFQDLFSDLLKQSVLHYEILSIKSVNHGLYLETTFSFLPKQGIDPADLINDFSKLNNNLKVSLVMSNQRDIL